MPQSHMAHGLSGNKTKLKDIRLKNQQLLIKRWRLNGIREQYRNWIKHVSLSPPKSISMDTVTVKRRSNPN